MKANRERDKWSAAIWVLVLGIFPLYLNGFVNAQIFQVPELFWAFEFILWFLWPLVLVSVLMRTGHDALRQSGIHSQLCGRDLPTLLMLTCCGMMVASYWVNDIAYAWSAAWLPEEGYFNYGSMVPTEPRQRLFVALWFAATAAWVEELWFRGMFWHALRHQSAAGLKYLLLSPAVFALAHWESGPANVATTWAFGIFMCGAYLLFKNLWPLILGHFVLNFIVFFY